MAAHPTMAEMPLFFHAGALGDFLLSLPLLRWARRSWPEAAWTLSAAEEHARLAAAVFPRRVVVPPGSLAMAPLTARPLDPARLGALLDGHGGLVGFVPRSRELTAMARKLRPGLPVAVAEPLALALPAGETVESLLEPLAGQLDERDFALAPGELPPAGTPSLVLPAPRRFALVHIGASDPARRPRMAALEVQADACRARGLDVVWVRGPVEREAGVALPPGPGLDSPDLVDLAHAIAAAAMFIGGDTGPTHLAAALGTPTVALHTVPNPRWRPRGPHVTVVETWGGPRGPR